MTEANDVLEYQPRPVVFTEAERARMVEIILKVRFTTQDAEWLRNATVVQSFYEGRPSTANRGVTMENIEDWFAKFNASLTGVKPDGH